ncbi:hypothetical protein [Falsochrobactrum shanghaiense]
MDEAEYMALVDALEATSDKISRLGAGIIAALAFNVASDSRSFARRLGVAHALVLREVTLLGEQDDYIIIRQRDARTQRIHYVLSPAGETLLAEVRR